MNVRTVKILGREITIQDEELVMPKYSKIRGVVREPSWLALTLLKFFFLYLVIICIISFSINRFLKNKYKIILSLTTPIILAAIGILVWFTLRTACKAGYSGNACENCLLILLIKLLVYFKIHLYILIIK